jgi:hypothetical protein
MKIIRGLIQIGMVAGLVATACGKKEEKKEDQKPESVADLKISSALGLQLPSSLVKATGGSTTSLNLSSNLIGKKSSEACMTMEQTKRVIERLSEVGSMFCHLEAESAKMKFGTKYQVNVKSTQGSQVLKIWVDNSDSANLKVYQCRGSTLSQVINISGYAGAGKAKGSVNSVHNENGHSGGSNLDFDMTQDGIKLLKASMKDTNSEQNGGTFRNFVDMMLLDSGVSVIKMSAVGVMGSTNEFSDQGVTMFNGTIGQAFIKGSGKYNGQNYNWNSRSTFGADGITVDNATAPDAVKVAAASLPDKLPDTFSPTAPSGWDCSGTTETIEVDMTTSTGTGAAHQACEQNRDRSAFTGCHGSDFERGTQE